MLFFLLVFLLNYKGLTDGTKNITITTGGIMRLFKTSLRKRLQNLLRKLLGLNMSESDQRQRAQVIDTRAEVLLREVEAKAKLAEIKASQSASELASIHLSQFAGLYLLILVLAFVGSCLFIPADSIAVVAGLITLVVTSLSSILKTIVDGSADTLTKDKEKKDA